MTQEDLDLLVAPYGVKKTTIGDTEIQVRRVLLRGQQKTVRRAQVTAQKVTDALQATLARVVAGESDEDTEMAAAEALQDELREAMVEAIGAQVISQIPGLDDMALESVSLIYQHVTTVQQMALAEQLESLLPSSGG